MKASQRTRELVEGFLRANVAGVCGGCVALVFNSALGWIGEALGVGRSGAPDALSVLREAPWWLRLALPAAGMLTAALLLRAFAGAAHGGGFADVMESVSIKRGPLPFSCTLVRAVAALAIVASGNSVGREGLIIVLSAAAASALTGVLRTPVRERGLMLGCGVAAGFAAAYNAPIAGAIFALEIVIGNFAMELFAPVVVASVTATLFTRHVALLRDPVYHGLPTIELVSLVEIVPYLLLGVLAGFAAVGFQVALRRTAQFVRSLPAPREVTMAAGGLAVGALAVVYPEVWGNGYSAVSDMLHKSGDFADMSVFPEFAVLMITLMVVKSVATSITVGSGGSGGVFTPTLFLGAALGGAFGVLTHHLLPSVTGEYGGYALVGMGALVAGTTRAPIMAVMVMFEMTLDYDIVLPLMLGCITASLVARTLHPHSIYTEELADRGTKTPLGLEETVLVTTRAEDVMRQTPTWVSRKTTYGEIVPLVTASRASAVNVCGDDMRFLGVIRVHDVIDLLAMGDIGPGIVAADLMSPVEPVTRDEPLSSVFEAFDLNDLDEMPIVDGLATRRLVGTVTRRDVMAALHMEVLKRQNLRAKFVRREEEQAQTDYVELPKGVELARVPAHPADVGRTFGEAGIRTTHRLTVLSVVRHDESGREIRVLPDGATHVVKGDELIVIAARDDIARWRAEVGAQ
jgi:CIC family chloride channel protein